jgi:hypothetical protein
MSTQQLLKEIKDIILDRFGGEDSSVYHAVCWEPRQYTAELLDSRRRYDFFPDSLADALAESKVGRIPSNPDNIPFWQGMILGWCGLDVILDWEDDSASMPPVGKSVYTSYLKFVRSTLDTVSYPNLIRVLKQLWGLWASASPLKDLDQKARAWYARLSEETIKKEGSW